MTLNGITNLIFYPSKWVSSSIENCIKHEGLSSRIKKIALGAFAFISAAYLLRLATHAITSKKSIPEKDDASRLERPKTEKNEAISFEKDALTIANEFFQLPENLENASYEYNPADEPTRFKIEDDKDFYYNANWVLNRRAIAAMAPVNGETEKFWQMVWHSQSTAIVMLNGCSSHYPIYWPEPAISRSIASNDLGIVLTNAQVIYVEGSVAIVKRELLLTYLKEQRTISQYHIQKWSQMSEISEKSLANLVLLISKHVEEKKGPILVHCRSALGNTGAFLATYEAYNQWRSGNRSPHLIRDITRDLRDPEKGKTGMIQSEAQYKLVYRTTKFLIEHPELT